MFDFDNLPKSKFRFAVNKTVYKVVPRNVRVYFRQCKHLMTFKNTDTHNSWTLGAERPDSNGLLNAREIYGLCPNCRR